MLKPSAGCGEGLSSGLDRRTSLDRESRVGLIVIALGVATMMLGACSDRTAKTPDLGLARDRGHVLDGRQGGDGLRDATRTDATRPDAAQPDATLPDVSLPPDEALPPDAARPDAVPDAALPDAALPDAALPDAALPDAALPDAALPDAALPDVAADAAIADTSRPADAGPVDTVCQFGQATSLAAPGQLDLFGTPAYFNNGQPLAAGTYRIRYLDGCMKYGGGQGWTVNAYAANQACWYVIGATTSDRIVVPPGTIGWQAGNGAHALFADCVAASLAVPPVVFTTTVAQPLGIWLLDSPYSDNMAGENGRNPRWSLEALGGCSGDQ